MEANRNITHDGPGTTWPAWKLCSWTTMTICVRPSRQAAVPEFNCYCNDSHTGRLTVFMCL